MRTISKKERKLRSLLELTRVSAREALFSLSQEEFDQANGVTIPKCRSEFYLASWVCVAREVFVSEDLSRSVTIEVQKRKYRSQDERIQVHVDDDGKDLVTQESALPLYLLVRDTLESGLISITELVARKGF